MFRLCGTFFILIMFFKSFVTAAALAKWDRTDIETALLELVFKNDMQITVAWTWTVYLGGKIYDMVILLRFTWGQTHQVSKVSLYECKQIKFTILREMLIVLIIWFYIWISFFHTSWICMSASAVTGEKNNSSTHFKIFISLLPCVIIFLVIRCNLTRRNVIRDPWCWYTQSIFNIHCQYPLGWIHVLSAVYWMIMLYWTP